LLLFFPIVLSDSCDSVNKFLRAVTAAKSSKRQAVDESLAEYLDDPDTIGVPVSLSRAVDELVEQYGDEALRSIALWSLGRWLQVHQRILQDRLITGDCSAAAWTSSDLTLIRTGLRVISEVGAFGGNEHWRAMLKEEIGQAVLEGMEEAGYDPLAGQ
jgi:hypothetical protein